jgi:outer membrane protein assembly factor BamB
VAVAPDGILRFGSSNDFYSHHPPAGSLRALSAGGELLWTVRTTGALCGAMAVDPTGAVYAVASTLHGPDEVVALEADGSDRLRVPLPDRGFQSCEDLNLTGRPFSTSSVILGDGRLYVGSENGYLHVVE